MASMEQTLDKVIAANPDRIALYNYAHLPHLFKPQRRISKPTCRRGRQAGLLALCIRACATPATSTSAWTISPSRTTNWPWRSAGPAAAQLPGLFHARRSGADFVRRVGHQRRRRDLQPE
jgi:hypothetical protein